MGVTFRYRKTRLKPIFLEEIMTIDARTRMILLDKLNFSPSVISRLEKNDDLLSRTLCLIELVRQKNLQKDRKLFVRKQLGKIRCILERETHNKDLLNARAAYYSFQ